MRWERTEQSKLPGKRMNSVLPLLPRGTLGTGFGEHKPAASRSITRAQAARTAERSVVYERARNELMGACAVVSARGCDLEASCLAGAAVESALSLSAPPGALREDGADWDGYLFRLGRQHFYRRLHRRAWWRRAVAARAHARSRSCRPHARRQHDRRRPRRPRSGTGSRGRSDASSRPPERVAAIA